MSRVLVIGAGISGITASKILLDDGFDVTCVERMSNVGGCWNNAYDFVMLQNSRDEYHFPGVPFPPETCFRPGKADIIAYWSSFVDMFDLRSRIRFNTEVVSLGRSQEGDKTWLAELRRYNSEYPSQSSPPSVEVYDFVIVASGVGYGTPGLACMPKIPQHSYPGQVVHAVDIPCDELPDKNEKVVIMGFGSTSVAFADEYAKHAAKNGNIHLVVQEPRWFVPTRILGLIPHCSILYSRATGIMLPSFFHGSLIERIIHLPIFKFLVHAFWWMIGLLLIVSARPPSALIPKRETALQGMRNAIPVLPDTFLQQCNSGRIHVHVPATVEDLRENGDVVLSNGETISSVNRIVCCTGYITSRFEWMSDELRALILDNGFPKQLYRHIVVPGLNNIAFIGFSSGFHGCVSEFIASNWVSSLFKGEVVLPSPKDMENDIEHLVRWKKENILYEYHYPYAIGSRFFNYEDQLLLDMNISPHRKRNPLTWLFSRWIADDYAAIPEERRRMRCKLNSPKVE